MRDSTFSGWRLLKANVSLNTNSLGSESSEEQWRIYSAEVIVAAQLLESILRENTRRFIVHRERKTGLLVSTSPHLGMNVANSMYSSGFLILTSIIHMSMQLKKSLAKKL